MDNLYEILDKKLTSYIHRNRLRDTPGRHLILQKICEEYESFTANDIYSSILVSEYGEDISDRCIYYTLNLFENIGLISRIKKYGNYKIYRINEEYLSLFSIDCK